MPTLRRLLPVARRSSVGGYLVGWFRVLLGSGMHRAR